MLQYASPPSMRGSTGRITQLLTMSNADSELGNLQGDSGENDGRAKGRDQQPGAPFRDIIMLHPAGHSHQAQDVQRHERDVEADEPAPERGLAKSLVQPETERFGKPIIVAGERAEEHSTDDDVVEMGYQEKAVVQHEVR